MWISQSADLIVGFLLGLFGMWLYYKKTNVNRPSSEEVEELQEKLERTKIHEAVCEERLTVLNQQDKDQKKGIHVLRNRVSEEKTKVTELTASNLALEKQLEERGKNLQELQDRFRLEFENLSNRLLDEKSEKFAVRNEEQLGQLLGPLGERIRNFEDEIRKIHLEESKQRASLKQQFVQLSALNQQMSTDAKRLTEALKGENRTQGNWGELVLEKVLERSGLVKGREYEIQNNYTNGKSRLRPDVIVNLPDHKHIVIDAKVTLTHYEQYCSSEDLIERELAAQKHLSAVRKHIQGLASKNYQDIYELHSLDFVLLFLPVEPAFALALQNDPELFNKAFGQNIIIVSPTTLLATLRTIANIWRQEKRNKHALQIASESGKLYDKFVAFTDDLQKIGHHLKVTEQVYDKALNKLTIGRGNLVSRAEKIKQLGARTNKQFSAAFEQEADSTDIEEELISQNTPN